MSYPAYRTDRIITLDSLVEAAAAASPIPESSEPSHRIRRSESSSRSTSLPALQMSNQEDDANKTLSKSARIRQLIEQEPEIRNKEIVDRLTGHGVTVHDVGNVRTQLKRKVGKGKAKGKPAAPASKPSPTAASRPVSAAPAVSPDSEIRVSVEVLEAAMEFVNRAGGLNEAQFALTMIRRIKSL